MNVLKTRDEQERRKERKILYKSVKEGKVQWIYFTMKCMKVFGAYKIIIYMRVQKPATEVNPWGQQLTPGNMTHINTGGVL